VNDSTKQSSLPRRHWLTQGPDAGDGWPQQLLPLWPLLLLALLIILLTALGETGRELLRYQRDAMLSTHEYWRWFTGHLVHGSWQHTLLNLAGLAVIATLFRGSFTRRQWLVIALLSITCIDTGFWWLMPQLQWYVGLSGVLHGLLAAGAVAWWRMEERGFSAILTAIVVGKLCWEQWHGALPLSGELNVIVNAHLYGAVGGGLGGLCFVRSLPARAAAHQTARLTR
jgi:rhomboid family GlyGly-CTERM serine protease